MGPTNIALVKLFQADQALREAQANLDNASRSVRLMERRIVDLKEKSALAASNLRQQQAQAGQLDLDIKTRTAHIERLRAQQQAAKNHKEYQTFLTEINTEKIDRTKVEDELLKVMETVERLQIEVKALTEQLAGEQQKHDEARAALSGTLDALQAEVDRLVPIRQESAAALSAQARDQFERLAERFEGEAMSAIGKPHRRREEYVCSACNMDVVADVYNKLHSRDDLVPCPNCRRLLYIPDDLPPELAINQKEEPKEPKGKKKNGGEPAPASAEAPATE
jgi:predicted  nucleic acid-binding Zn-ribbon protein